VRLRAKGETKIASERGVQPFAEVLRSQHRACDGVAKRHGRRAAGAIKAVEDRVRKRDLEVLFRITRSKTRLWVNTMLGNVKNSLRGTLHAISRKHVPRYLAEFEYRFNRRFHLPAMIERLLFVALRTPPMPYRFLKMAEVYR
jgi:hypothetical protein